MSDQQVTINPKQLLIFLSIAIFSTIGLFVFFVKASNKKTTPTPTAKVNPQNSTPPINSKSKAGFLGEKGTEVKAVEGKIYIDEKQVKDGNMHSFNFYSEKEDKAIYFFIVKASDGTYRAAANACEVCFDAKKGFSQVGDLIRCENCRITYPKDKIALEKGGCNPGPIDKNVMVENGKLVIEAVDVENVSYLF